MSAYATPIGVFCIAEAILSTGSIEGNAYGFPVVGQFESSNPTISSIDQ